MKKLILMIAAVAMVSFTNAQSPTDDLFEKYSNEEGFTIVKVTKELFNLFADFAEEAEGEEMEDFNQVVKGLEQIRILMFEGSGKSDPDVLQDFKSELSDVKLKDFTELMTVREQDEMVKFMIRKNGKNIKELLLLINQDEEAGFISITGNIDLKSIAKLSKSMNIQGLENLQKLNGEDADVEIKIEK